MTTGVPIVIIDNGVPGSFGAIATIGSVPLKVVHCASPALLTVTPTRSGTSTHGACSPQNAGNGETLCPSVYIPVATNCTVPLAESSAVAVAGLMLIDSS